MPGLMSGAGEYDHFEISWFAPIFVGIGVARCFAMHPVIYFLILCLLFYLQILIVRKCSIIGRLYYMLTELQIFFKL